MWSRLWHNYSYTFPPLRFLGHCVPRLLLGMNHRRNVLALTRNKHHRIPPSYYTSPHRVMQVYSEPRFFTKLKRPLGKREEACIGFFCKWWRGKTKAHSNSSHPTIQDVFEQKPQRGWLFSFMLQSPLPCICYCESASLPCCCSCN